MPARGGTGRRLLLTALAALGVVPQLGTSVPSDAPVTRRRAALALTACTTCHEFEPHLSHPVDVVPAMAVPAMLPLRNGRVTCDTCHHPCADGSRAPVRMEGICFECHGKTASTRASAHAIGLGRAHLRAVPEKPVSASGLDLESATCLSCHDGAVARGGDAMGAAGSPIPTHLPGLYNGRHPIAVIQQPRGPGDTLRPASAVDPAIRLFDGHVGCGSCHSVFAERRHLLVMDNHASRLCLGCHDM